MMSTSYHAALVVGALALLVPLGCAKQPRYAVSEAVVVYPFYLEGRPMPEGFAEGMAGIFREYDLGEVLERSRIDVRPARIVAVYRLRFDLDGETAYLEFHRGTAEAVLQVGKALYAFKSLPLFVHFWESIAGIDERAGDRLWIDSINASESLQLTAPGG